MKQIDCAMDTIKIKNRIRNYIEHADEYILKIIHIIIESQTEEEGLTERHKEILDERLKYHKENPTEGKSWEEIQKSLQEQYGL